MSAGTGHVSIASGIFNVRRCVTGARRFAARGAPVLAVGLLTMFAVLLDAGAAPAPHNLARSTDADNRAGLAPSSERIRQTQKALATLGFYRAAVDGVFGPATEDAIRTYQQTTGQPIDLRLTDELIDGLETRATEIALRRRLERVRLQGRLAARRALLDSSATRDLIERGPSSASRPSENAPRRACAHHLDLTCLLDEASAAARMVRASNLRDWAYGEILVAQARAGLDVPAKETLAEIRDSRLQLVGLRNIAEAQALRGHVEDAAATAEIIPDPTVRAEALTAIADIEARRPSGDVTVLERIAEGTGTVPDSLEAVVLHARAAVMMDRFGSPKERDRHLASAEAVARRLGDPDAVSSALRHVAAALAELRQAPRALALVDHIDDSYARMPILAAIAKAQAHGGHAEPALVTADSIAEAGYRAAAFNAIAAALAAEGRLGEARAALQSGVAAAREIERAYARSHALSRLALTAVDLADAEDTRDLSDVAAIAEEIPEPSLRATVLWEIAADPHAARGAASPRDMESRASSATERIRGRFRKVWLFGDVAERLASRGRADAAAAVVERGLEVARGIVSPWSRARAYARLARALTKLPPYTTTASGVLVPRQAVD